MKKQKRWWLWVIAIILILAAIIFYLSLRQVQEVSGKQKIYKDLKINYTYEFLRECKSIEFQDKSALPENLRTCPEEISQNTLNQLELIKDFKGVLVCNNYLPNENPENYKDCENITDNCEIVSRLSFKSSATSAGNIPTSDTYYFYECDEYNVFIKSSSPPLRIAVYELDPKIDLKDYF